MHPEAYEGFGRMLLLSGVDADAPLGVLDIGGQNVNGSVHQWFSNALITTLDLENADIIADATTWVPDRQWDVVICTEVFEHVPQWPRILKTARAALSPGGVFIFTCASTHRAPHGATGAPLPAPGEWYANVPPGTIEVALDTAGFRVKHVEYQYPPGDAYGYGIA